jgi:glutaminyl-tRNA synthetase
VVKNGETGDIEEIHCTYDPETKGGWSDDGRKVKGTLHWVSVKHAIDAQVKLFDRLFVEENIEEIDDFLQYLNPNSLTILDNCKLEPGLESSSEGDRYQFLRQGYFARDPEDTEDGRPVFNRIVALRDSWAKIEKAHGT